MSKPKKAGRPPRAGKTATERIDIRVTPAERKAWERRARASECSSVSEWVRSLCNYEGSQHE